MAELRRYRIAVGNSPKVGLYCHWQHAQAGHGHGYENHRLPGFNFNVEEWDAKGQTYETLVI